MKKNTNELARQVSVCIRELGIPAHLKGYRYLRTAVILGITKSALLNSFTKGLYPMVANQHETTSVRVERAIRGGIEFAWKHNQGKIHALRGYTSGRKPTNAEMVNIIVDNIVLTQTKEDIKEIS